MWKLVEICSRQVAYVGRDVYIGEIDRMIILYEFLMQVVIPFFVSMAFFWYNVDVE